MNTPRIGFACQYRHSIRALTLAELKLIEGAYNPRTTTLRWMNSVATQVAHEKLQEVITHNLLAQLQLLDYVAQLPEALRMLRLSSDLLPFYSHPQVAAFYQQPERQAWLAERFAQMGDRARSAGIRLSFHPGQFCVLGSDKPPVVENSLAEFEYHADMIRMMGYGVQFQDFKCNVHIAGRLGAEGIRAIWPRLSEVARRCITFENEEKTYGVDETGRPGTGGAGYPPLLDQRERLHRRGRSPCGSHHRQLARRAPGHALLAAPGAPPGAGLYRRAEAGDGSAAAGGFQA